jgi:hypothetical protein
MFGVIAIVFVGVFNAMNNLFMVAISPANVSLIKPPTGPERAELTRGSQRHGSTRHIPAD